MPLLVLELVQLVSLPVNSVNRPVKGVSNSGDLKGKDVVLELIVGFTDAVCLRVKKECLVREGSVETSHDKDFIFIYLTNARALSWT